MPLAGGRRAFDALFPNPRLRNLHERPCCGAGLVAGAQAEGYLAVDGNLGRQGGQGEGASFRMREGRTLKPRPALASDMTA